MTMHRIPLLLSLLCACGAPPTSLDLARPVDSAMSLLSDAGVVDASGGSRDMVSLPPSRVVVEYSVVDGQRLPIGFYDTGLDVRCSVTQTTAGLRCIPSDIANTTSVGGYFVDAGCTQLYGVSFPSCSPPKYLTYSQGFCQITRLYLLGAPTAPSSVYVGTPGACSRVAAASSLTYSPVVAEIDPTTLSQGNYVH